ncbi:MAG: HAD-IC family P-type ATPase [Minisyncoccia bacterium]
MDVEGLTSRAAEEYQRAHGYNEIVEKKDSLALRILKKAASPISGMLLLAAVLSLLSGKGFDGIFILVLLVLNVGITVWQENKADTAIEKLNEHLSVSIKTCRDGAWTQISSRLLVPDDIIELASGSVIPADAEVVSAAHASANEAALTGESLPKDKAAGDALYSGSFVASGIITARVTAIGSSTRFGKVLTKVERGGKKSSLERTILRMTRFLSVLSLVAVLLLSWTLYAQSASILEIIRLDLSLVIAGIPISLPTVMTLIIAFGVIALAKKDVVVRRLASLQDLANADLLLTDKTGTLTENRIRVDAVIPYGSASADSVLTLSSAVAAGDPDAALNQALLARSAADEGTVIDFAPGDSERKRSTVTREKDGKHETLSLGAPQVIESLCALSDEERTRFRADVDALASHGYRALALARASGDEEKDMQLLGLVSLSDTLRSDAKDVISFLKENGVGVVMVTGDNAAIAREVAEKLDLPGTDVSAREKLLAAGFDHLSAGDFRNTRAFAEILPEDKYNLVVTAKKWYTVASNGDGVNDLPAVRAADVGFAVSNAVDVLRGAADIVLLSPGIAVMRDAFLEGRKIFARLYSYSLYRISESFRLIVTIVILGYLTGTYPLSPLQLILLALLNDIPIISLATDRVRIASRPSSINVRKQYTRSLLFGCVGIMESLLLYFVAVHFFKLSLPVVQTLFFLKLSVSGQLLIYVAHTDERWWRYLPSWQVIAATAATQTVSTTLALTGFLMSAGISWKIAIFVWLWTIVFMQVAEATKLRITRTAPEPPTPTSAKA